MGNIKSERFDTKIDYDKIWERYLDLKVKYPHWSYVRIAERLRISIGSLYSVRRKYGDI